MPRLGDFFEPEEQAAHLARQLVPGHILWIPQCSITRPPKDKFAVIAAVAPEAPLLLLINSRIAPLLCRRPDMSRRQVPISSECYGFLHHDSYVNCAQVHDSITWRDLIAAADGSPGEVERQLVRGVLTTADKSSVVTAVQGASTVTPEHQDMIRDALQT